MEAPFDGLLITTNDMTGTANFNSNKDNFRPLSSQGHFESIVMIINLYPNERFNSGISHVRF